MLHYKHLQEGDREGKNGMEKDSVDITALS